MDQLGKDARIIMSGPLATDSEVQTRPVKRDRNFRGPLEDLRRELALFRITTSPLCPGFNFDRWLADVRSCSMIKENARRRVYFLQTPGGGYFIKCSILERRKDRRRHFLLPARKWAEWRNLHRLRKAEIPVAQPLARGYKRQPYPGAFFLLTEQAPGAPLKFCELEQVQRLGKYAAGLHAAGMVHADLNRSNLLVTAAGRLCLIDVQEVFFLPWIPHRLRVYNLGKIIFYLAPLEDLQQWTSEFLKGYNRRWKKTVSLAEALRAAEYHRRRRYRSRSKRCCKNSSQFEIVHHQNLSGYKRRDFNWGVQELHLATEQGKTLKADHVLVYQGVCVKHQPRKMFHQDRCLASWKMSRALKVRGIGVPRALGYYAQKERSWFISAYLANSVHLNDYLSTLTDRGKKRRALKKLALLVKKCHDNRVWQRDFKSSNILCCNGDFYMVDLDAVRICHLSENKKIINLAQLNASLSNAVTIKDRLRFYYYYSAGRPSTRPQRRTVYRKVWEISRTKNTAIYNLDLEKLCWPDPGRRP